MEYGKINSIEETDKGYFTISIIQKVAYNTKLRKFNVWNVKELKKVMGDALCKDTLVTFTSKKDGVYHKLVTMEESNFSECSGCGAYTPLRNKQQIECELCYGSPMEHPRLEEELKLVKTQIKEYTYSPGITLTFCGDVKEDSLLNHLYVTTVFENSYLYNKLTELKVGDKKHVSGWVDKTDDNSVTFFNVEDVKNIL